VITLAATTTAETVLRWLVVIPGDNDVFASHWDAKSTVDEALSEI
jgi:hypothetical protein